MDKKIKSLIENRYGFSIMSDIPGPRQFVAETHVIEIDKGEKYFVKQINFSKYSESTVKSLPVLKQLYEIGIKNINFPIPTTSGDLYLLADNILIILFNYIDAVQTFDFEYGNFARLIASIHSSTDQVKADIEKETFTPLYLNDLPGLLETATIDNSSDEITRKLSKLLMPLKEELNSDWSKFIKICDDCKNSTFDLRLTHGDPVGNVMKDRQGNLFLIDWDEIKLAPVERDTWFSFDNHEFMLAYSHAVQGYSPNNLAYSFYVHNRYWDDVRGFVEEILSNKPNDHREENLKGLDQDCFHWLRPLIRKL